MTGNPSMLPADRHALRMLVDQAAAENLGRAALSSPDRTQSGVRAASRARRPAQSAAPARVDRVRGLCVGACACSGGDVGSTGMRYESVQVEQGGLSVNIRLIEPDREAWHLRISDAQLTTCHVIAKDSKLAKVEAAIIQHLAKKVELSRAN
jgi:hypothetical protein